MWRVAAVIAVCLVGWLGPIVLAQDVPRWEERLNDIELNRINVGDFSVLFEASSLTTPLGEKKAGSVNMYIARLARKGKVIRSDFFRQSISADQDVKLYYHTLQGQNRLHVTDFKFGGGSIQSNIGETGKYVFFERMDPLTQCMMPYAAINSNRLPFSKRWAEFELLSESTEPDGKYTVFVVLGNNGGAANVTFGKEPNWAPIQVDFYTPLGAKDLSDNPSPEEYRKKWPLYSKTKTKWMKLADDQWVPREMFVTQCADDEDRKEIEMLFADWKVGKDFDKSILEEKNFTMENIVSTVNFGEWKEKLEAARKK